MRYQCISKTEFDLWLTVGKIYEGDVVITPRAFAGTYIEIKRVDDNFPAYVPIIHFKTYQDIQGEQGLGV
jgi:hypothetical protein